MKIVTAYETLYNGVHCKKQLYFYLEINQYCARKDYENIYIYNYQTLDFRKIL